MTNDPAFRLPERERFFCPFLDHFVKYSELSSQDVASHIQEEYLTPLTSKVALEESEGVKKIRDEELQNWRDSRVRNRMGKEDMPEDRTIDENPRPRKRQTAVALSQQEDEEPILPFYSLSDKPIVVHRVTAAYPDIAKKAGIEGTVVLKVLIDTKGNVERVEVLKSHPLLDASAIEAAKQFKFRPGKQRGKTVKVWMSIPFTFKIKDTDRYPDYQDQESMADSAKWFHYLGRDFIYAIILGEKVLIEKGFNLQQAMVVEFHSREHFNLLYQDPGLIKYSLRQPAVLFAGINNKEQWYFITTMRTR